MVNIPEEIVKVKQEVEADLFGEDPVWARVESHVRALHIWIFIKFQFLLFYRTLFEHDFPCPVPQNHLYVACFICLISSILINRAKVSPRAVILNQTIVIGVHDLLNFLLLLRRDPGKQFVKIGNLVVDSMKLLVRSN